MYLRIDGFFNKQCDSCEQRVAEYKFVYADATFNICNGCLPLHGYERQMFELGVGCIAKIHG